MLLVEDSEVSIKDLKYPCQYVSHRANRGESRGKTKAKAYKCFPQMEMKYPIFKAGIKDPTIYTVKSGNPVLTQDLKGGFKEGDPDPTDPNNKFWESV
jgi:hypothetical protein